MRISKSNFEMAHFEIKFRNRVWVGTAFQNVRKCPFLLLDLVSVAYWQRATFDPFEGKICMMRVRLRLWAHLFNFKMPFSQNFYGKLANLMMMTLVYFIFLRPIVTVRADLRTWTFLNFLNNEVTRRSKNHPLLSMCLLHSMLRQYGWAI